MTKRDLDAGSPDVNLRSSGYFIANASVTCWRCGESTRVVGLALPPGHSTLELGDDESEDALDLWSVAPYNVIFFYVEYVTDAAVGRLTSLAPSYRLDGKANSNAEGCGRGDEEVSGCWANHCEHCGLTLDDHELHCEPDGAFLPTSASSAESIHLTWVDEPIEAAAAGYAIEPQFFDAMSRD